MAMHVLVIGSGCTGLLIAQGLKKAGIASTVFERSERDRRFRDWSMQLHWGRDCIEELLPVHLIHRLKEAETDPWIQLTKHEQSHVPVYNGKTGEVLAELHRPSICRYSRAKLIKVLSEGLDIRHDSELADIQVDSDGSVQASFEDGTTAIGDVLVGADSASSMVRTWLLGGDQARCSEAPIVAYNFCAQYLPELAIRLREQAHPLMLCAVHPEQRTWYMIATLDVNDPRRPESWVFQHFMNLWTEEQPSNDPITRLRHFQQLGMMHAEPFRSAAREVEDDTFVPYDRLKYWANPVRWNNQTGRVTLAGDAAHPMTPHRGQGLNNAFQDAANFVSAITKTYEGSETTTLAAEIDRYDEELFARGKQEIDVSFRQSYDSTHWEAYLDSVSVKHGHLPVR